MLTAILATLLFILVVVLSVIIWSIKRHRDPDLHIECDYPIESSCRRLPASRLSTAVDGNSVEIFENGAYFDVLIEDIGKARHSVHFETFLWEEGVAGQARRGRLGGACEGRPAGARAARRDRLEEDGDASSVR